MHWRYPRESQEMVFDAHDRALASFKGTCTRGIYDNMKTAVDAILVAKADVTMSHYSLRSLEQLRAATGAVTEEILRLSRQRLEIAAEAS